ncbi:unnamed protein product [Symbiodinium sp. CCMP2592]|nr:unnamed protein product [Symbiodinium sp. CCMP2592]
MWEKFLVALTVLLGKGLEPSRFVPLVNQCECDCRCDCGTTEEFESPREAGVPGWILLICAAVASHLLTIALAFRIASRIWSPSRTSESVTGNSVRRRGPSMELGSLLRVWYTDDDVWHERIVLLHGDGDDMYWVVTPDLDVYEENLGGNAVDGPERVRKVAHGARSRYNRPIYRFRDVVDNAFVSKYIKEAWREHEGLHGMPPETEGVQVHLPDGFVKDLVSFGPRFRVREKSAPGTPTRPAVVDARAASSGAGGSPPVDFETWVVMYQSNGEGLGEQVVPPKDAGLLRTEGRCYKIFDREGVVCLVQGCSPEEAHRVSLAAKEQSRDRDREERDVRVLPVLFDSADERWRTLGEAIPDYEEIEYEDFPLQGPRTMYRDLKQLRRLGMSFVQHHESWVRKSGVRSSDRSIYEHSTLCRSLDYMASYDQLNLPALACAEALNRRRALIELAHQGRPEAPSYEAAEEVLGVRESGDGSVVDPALTQHAAKRQAAKAEVLKQTRLAAEEKRHAYRRSEEENGGAERPGKGNGKKKKDEQNAP